MPIAMYTDNWTPEQLDIDVQAAYTKTKNWGDAAGELNNMGWSMNNFKVRDYVKKTYPALYAGWKAKYSSFFKTDPMTYIIYGGLALAAYGFWVTTMKKG